MLRESPNLFSTRKENSWNATVRLWFPALLIWFVTPKLGVFIKLQSGQRLTSGKNARRSGLSVSESKAKYMFLPFIDIQIARHNDQRKFYDEMDRSITNTRLEVTTKT